MYDVAKRRRISSNPVVVEEVVNSESGATELEKAISISQSPFKQNADAVNGGEGAIDGEDHNVTFDYGENVDPDLHSLVKDMAAMEREIDSGYVEIVEECNNGQGTWGSPPRTHHNDANTNHPHRIMPPPNAVPLPRVPRATEDNPMNSTTLHEMGIRDVLSLNLALAKKKDNLTRRPSAECDIPALSLHPSFFVCGVKIHFPYSVIQQPQRQMALHIVRALRDRRHVILESPTGTGKSAAILCAVLAWRKAELRKRYDRAGAATGGNSEEENETHVPPKVYYCSRTHSQVAQMAASLRGTPYRPRMAVLGSRDRLCINTYVR
mmetsp:Transcript_36084/g.84288  ORF Transcript_36084/g.84288 Transcript_36084/m.84288 type:complete len:323 (+) Transcript_36084:148-1116(+)